MSTSKLFLNYLLGALTAFSVLACPAEAWYSGTRWDCCQNAPHLCPAQPCCEDCGPFGGAELIYWTVEQSDLDYVADHEFEVVDPSAQVNGSTVVGPKNLHFVDHEWDLGFRALAGYRIGCDGWDASLRYTYFHSSARDSTDVITDGEVEDAELLPVLLHPGMGRVVPIVKASARVSTQFEVLDFTFSRPFCVSDTLIVRPFWGARGLWLAQSYKAAYGELLVTEPTGDTSANNKEPLAFNFCRVKYSGETSGVGIVAGVNSIVHICEAFSLYGDVRGSILYAQNRFRHRQRFEEDTPRVNLKEQQNAPLATYELGVGGNWETMICDYCILVDLGYEFTHVIPTSRNRRYVNSTTPGVSTGALTQDTIFHGLRASASVYF